jgi:hypothetical protein
MNSGKCILQRFSILVVVLSVSAVAFAGRTPQKSQEHKSAPSKPASHAGQTQHGGGHAPSGGHTATTGHTQTGGHTATAGHSSVGGHTTNTGHSSNGGHTATAGHSTVGGHSTAGGHTAMTGHSSPGGHTTTGHTPTGVRNVSLKGGGRASVRSNGQIRSVDRGGMHINHGINGGRTVVSEHNGVRVVNTGRGGGYVQRAYVNRGGHSYYSRTYYYGGSYHTSVYRGYYWGGHAYYGFHAGFWFHPGFYAWGYHPWGSPLYWGVGLWGWGGSPWWGFYGGWFRPYPYYAAPAYWLTDYLVAAELQSAYAARQEAVADAVAADASAAANSGDGGGSAPAASASSTVTLSPEVKEAIADEVKAELAAQQAEAAQNGSTQTGSTQTGSAQTGGPAPNSGSDSQAAATPANSTPERPPALDPARRTFVVDGNLTVTSNGQECGLTGGDVLTRLTDTPDADNMVSASVSASKNSDCASGQTVSVKVDDLQEMQNHFDEQLDNGMKELAKKQGTDGMPKAPDTTVVESDIPPPQPDTTAEKTLQDQQQAADQAETQVKQEATAAPAPSGGQQ